MGTQHVYAPTIVESIKRVNALHCHDQLYGYTCYLRRHVHDINTMTAAAAAIVSIAVSLNIS